MKSRHYRHIGVPGYVSFQHRTSGMGLTGTTLNKDNCQIYTLQDACPEKTDKSFSALMVAVLSGP